MTANQKTCSAQAAGVRAKIERLKDELSRAERTGRDPRSPYYADLLAELAWWEGVLSGRNL